MMIDRARAYKNKIDAWGKADSRWRKNKAAGITAARRVNKSSAKRQRRSDLNSFQGLAETHGGPPSSLLLVPSSVEPDDWLDLPGHDLQLNTLDAQGKARLHQAVEEENFSEVSRLLSIGAAVDQFDGEGNASLIIATNRGYTSIIELLLKHGADVNSPDKDGRRPVHLCLLRPLDLEVLLKANANPSEADKEGNTALHLIFQRSEWLAERAEAGMHLLLSYGANVNALNNSGDTPLHLMINNTSFLQLDKYLHEFVANRADLKISDSSGQQPFQLFVSRADDLSCWSAWTSVFDLFVNKDATCNAFFKGEHILVSLLQEDEDGELEAIILNLCSLVSQGEGKSILAKENILHDVVLYESYKKQESLEQYLSALLKSSIDPNQLNEFGYTALHILIRMLKTQQDADRILPLMKILLEHGASPLRRGFLVPQEPPLYQAYRYAKTEFREDLIRQSQIMDMLFEAMFSQGISNHRLGCLRDGEHDWWNQCLTLYKETEKSSYGAFLDFLKLPTSIFPEDIATLPAFLAQTVATKMLADLVSYFRSREYECSQSRASLSSKIILVLRHCKRLEIEVDGKFEEFLAEMLEHLQETMDAVILLRSKYNELKV